MMITTYTAYQIQMTKYLKAESVDDNNNLLHIHDNIPTLVEMQIKVFRIPFLITITRRYHKPCLTAQLKEE